MNLLGGMPVLHRGWHPQTRFGGASALVSLTTDEHGFTQMIESTKLVDRKLPQLYTHGKATDTQTHTQALRNNMAGNRLVGWVSRRAVLAS